MLVRRMLVETFEASHLQQEAMMKNLGSQIKLLYPLVLQSQTVHIFGFMFTPAYPERSS